MGIQPSEDRTTTATAGTAEEPRGWATVDRPIFYIPVGLVVAICLLGVLFTAAVGEVAGTALNWVTSTFGWVFILGSAAFVVFSVVLAFGRFGSIPISREGEETEFSRISWIAMMFSAGMGIG